MGRLVVEQGRMCCSVYCTTVCVLSYLSVFYTFPEPSVRICTVFVCFFSSNRQKLSWLGHEYAASHPAINASSCLSRRQTAGGRVHLCNSSCSLIPLTVTQVLAMEDQPLHSERREDSGAFMLTAVFIYSLTGGLLLSSASEDRSHLFPYPVPPPQVWNSNASDFQICLGRVGSHKMRTHTYTHTAASASLSSPAMNERDWRDSESQRKNEGWSRGAPGSVARQILSIGLVRESSGF